MTNSTKTIWTKEISGALSAVLVSLPGNLAFGLIAFAPLGDDYISLSIYAAMYSSIIIGVVSGLFGGVPGLISGPQVITAMLFATLIVGLSVSLSEVLPNPDIAELLTCAFLAVFIAGLMQAIFGAVKVGNLVKFIPYPVTAGFLTGAIILIMEGQIWTLCGMRKYPSLLDLFRHTDEILWPAVLVGLLTMVVMFYASRISKKVPAPIVALIFGSLLYYLMQYMGFGHGLGGVLGTIKIALPEPEYAPRFLEMITSVHFGAILKLIFASALGFAILNTIDCLSSIVAVQTHLDNKPKINKELVAQGIGNAMSAIFGGLPGSGFVGRTFVNLKSGGRTGLSTVLASIFLLMALYLFSPAIALIPKVVISAVIIVVLFQIFDPWILRLFRKLFSIKTLRHTEYIENILSISLVVFITLKYDIVTAVGCGIVLSVVMFVLKMTRSPVRHIYYGSTIRSNRMRDEESVRLLKEHGNRIVIVHLDGVLFFATAEDIQNTVIDLAKNGPKCIILDMTRVNTVDSTGAKILMQTYAKLDEQGVVLLFAKLSQKSKLYLVMKDLGFFPIVEENRLFPDLDRALEGAEDILLSTLGVLDSEGKVYQLTDFAMFDGMSEDGRSIIEKQFITQTYTRGDVLFHYGDESDGLYLISSGSFEVYINNPENNQRIRLRTLAAGSFFGEMSLIEAAPRSASVECVESGVIFRMDTEGFKGLSERHPELAIYLLSSMVRILSDRLRSNDKIKDLIL